MATSRNPPRPAPMRRRLGNRSTSAENASSENRSVRRRDPANQLDYSSDGLLTILVRDA